MTYLLEFALVVDGGAQVRQAVLKGQLCLTATSHALVEVPRICFGAARGARVMARDAAGVMAGVAVTVRARVGASVRASVRVTVMVTIRARARARAKVGAELGPELRLASGLRLQLRPSHLCPGSGSSWCS